MIAPPFPDSQAPDSIKNDQVMALDLDTLDLEKSAAVTRNFDKVQGLRDLKDDALSLSAHCKSSLELIDRFQEIPGADFQNVWSLDSYKAQLVGYVENMSVLTSRIGNTVDLVSLCGCEIGGIHLLMASVFALVRICHRLEESVHRCRH